MMISLGGLKEKVTINLSNNSLTHFESSVFQEVLEKIAVSGNGMLNLSQSQFCCSAIRISKRLHFYF